MGVFLSVPNIVSFSIPPWAFLRSPPGISPFPLGRFSVQSNLAYFSLHPFKTLQSRSINIKHLSWITLTNYDNLFERSSRRQSTLMIPGNVAVPPDCVLPSQLLRRWKKVGRILNIANVLGNIQVHERLVFFFSNSLFLIFNEFWRSYSDPEVILDREVEVIDETSDEEGDINDVFLDEDFFILTKQTEDQKRKTLSCSD